MEKTYHVKDPDIEETSNEDARGYELQFLDIVKSWGRPRGSGSGKTDFKIWSKQKSKKSRNLSKKQNDQEITNNIYKKPQEKVEAKAINQVPDKLLLVYPPGPGEISVFTQDNVHLAPGKWVSDIVVDFYLSYI